VFLTRPEPPTRTDWARAGLALGGRAAVLSGWDAVRLRDLGAARPPCEEILVLTSGGANRRVGPIRLRPSGRPVRVVRTATRDPAMPFAQLADTARAIADTCLTYRYLGPVRALVTSAVQRGLCTAEQLAGELDAGPRNGSALLRRALADAFDGARSIAEAEACELLAGGGVPAFELNVAIIDVSGRVIAVADVLWRELRAILEIDSREYHFSEPDWKATMRRHNRLLRLGLAVAHYPPSEIRSRGADWVDEVAAWLGARAVELGRPPPATVGVLRPGPSGPAPFVLSSM